MLALPPSARVDLLKSRLASNCSIQLGFNSLDAYRLTGRGQ